MTQYAPDNLALPLNTLSVRQPWAWALCAGHKDVENRTWAMTRPPGWCAIHAAKGLTKLEYNICRYYVEDTFGLTVPPPADLVRGAVIGVVYFERGVRDSTSKWAEPACHHFVVRRGSAMMLRDPIPVRGKLGFFNWKQHREQKIAPPLPWMKSHWLTEGQKP